MFEHNSIGNVEHLEQMAAFGQMARELLHEINTPLTSMQLNVLKIGRAMAQMPADEPAISAGVQRLNENLNRIVQLQEIIRDRYADLQRKNQARSNVENQLVRSSLLESLNHAIAQCRAASEDSKLTVRISVDPDLFVPYKAIELEEVWVNLLQNSIEAVAGQEAPWVHIEARPSSEQSPVHITFTDSGQIGSEIKARMFREEFTTKPIGTGLGLKIVKDIVESRGGSIVVQGPSLHTQFLVAFRRS